MIEKLYSYLPEHICWLSEFSLHQFRSKVLGVSLHGVLKALVLRYTQTKVAKFARHTVQTEEDVVRLDVKVTQVVVVKMTEAL